MELLSARDYAKVIGVSHTEVYNRLRNGEIPEDQIVRLKREVIKFKKPATGENERSGDKQ